VLLRARARLRDPEAHTLFAFLGMATFPVAVALGFLVYWCADPALALERVAVFIALAGVPVLASGVLVHSSPGEPAALAAGSDYPAANAAGSPGAGVSASTRTIATSIALAGMLILLAAVVVAWPEPVALILVCALDFAVLSIVAWRCRLP